MNDSVLHFYNNLSSDYHLIFADWHQSVIQQADILDRLIQQQSSSIQNPTLLDCSCGIGTQAIGLALKGYTVSATDLSSEAVKRARNEAKAFSVSLSFSVADFRFLEKQVPGVFDVVLSCDNALPHLLTDEDLLLAARNMRAKIRPGGLLLVSIRDYDKILEEKPRAELPRIFDTLKGRRITFQIWDWEDGNTYTVHLFIVRQIGNTWETKHSQTQYRALRREELTHILRQVGFSMISWHMPAETGYYQPIVTAKATS